ncbi:MAG: hypothetical protein ACTHM1_09740 [Solirubrobacteraceae bacterium]
MQDIEPVFDEVTDSAGRRVVLLERIWRSKVVVEHPEMQSLTPGVLGAIAAADHSEPDPRYPDGVHYFARGVGPSNWLMVVVSYEQVPARIITAFARRKDPPSWKPSI